MGIKRVPSPHAEKEVSAAASRDPKSILLHAMVALEPLTGRACLWFWMAGRELVSAMKRVAGGTFGWVNVNLDLFAILVHKLIVGRTDLDAVVALENEALRTWGGHDDWRRGHYSLACNWGDCDNQAGAG